jgi:GGDEF domain-containing protein
VLSEFHVGLRREYARAARYRQSLSLLLLDLPPTSDVLGRVRDAVRLCDSASPAPDDRVAVILPETALSGALLVATRLAGALGPSPTTGGPQSIGVAAYPSPSVADAEALMRAAEKAMESARSQGGGIRTPLAR